MIKKIFINYHNYIMLNINGKIDDTYRYKMPAIKSSIVGKGNGIYTIFFNLQDVGKYLNHPSFLLLKTDRGCSILCP